MWLFTWNAGRSYWANYDEQCKSTSRESPLIDSWSCQSKKVQIGDEFFLIKLGTLPRGIIGHGIVIGDVFDDKDWDGYRGKKAIHYVPCEWDTLLNYKTREILDVAVLDEKCPQQWWHPEGSGTRIKDEVLPTLYELWAKVTKEYPENPEESVYYQADTAGGILEGAKKSVYSTKYERDPKVRRAFLQGKELKCEVCGFDFGKTYGELGAGYIEVHHKKPVSDGERITDINEDLVMLCSNCHRMIHRGKDHMITVEELQNNLWLKHITQRSE